MIRTLICFLKGDSLYLGDEEPLHLQNLIKIVTFAHLKDRLSKVEVNPVRILCN